MTTVAQIITDAYRQSNLLPIGVSPTVDQQDEALRYLNRIVKSVFGNEAGDPFESFPIGRVDINRPAGYPWWDNVPDNNWWVPKNTRLMVNVDQPIEVFLHPDPDDGSRFAVIDVQGVFATQPFTVHGNGRLIEGQTSIVLNANNTDSEWFYRADLGNWQLYSPIALVDTFPFPEEFDDFFITLLAMRLNPAYGVQIDAQSQSIFNRSAKQLKARYDQEMPTRSELGLLRMPKTAVDRDRWGDSYWLYNPNSMFEKGWPY
jgi:hypothetical protein